MSREVIGILGVGHLARHLVPGLLRREPAPRLCLAPRSAGTACELAHRHDLPIAPDMASLVEMSSIVLIAVRPPQVEEALAGLPWRSDHVVVSLCAGVATSRLAPLVGQARVWRAMPVTAAAQGASPTSIWPDEPQLRRLFEPCGPVVALAGEEQFEFASVVACHYAWLQALNRDLAGRLTAEGLEEAAARTLLAGMMRAAAEVALARPAESLESLLEELVVPGSYSLAGLTRMAELEVLEGWGKTFDEVRRALSSKSGPMVPRAAEAASGGAEGRLHRSDTRL